MKAIIIAAALTAVMGWSAAGAAFAQTEPIPEAITEPLPGETAPVEVAQGAAATEPAVVALTAAAQAQPTASAQTLAARPKLSTEQKIAVAAGALTTLFQAFKTIQQQAATASAASAAP